MRSAVKVGGVILYWDAEQEEIPLKPHSKLLNGPCLNGTIETYLFRDKIVHELYKVIGDLHTHGSQQRLITAWSELHKCKAAHKH